MIVGLDATPLVAPLTGVGRYVAELCQAVSELPEPPEQVLTLFSRRRPLQVPLPGHARLAPRAVPARILHPLWRATGRPPVELLTGPLDVFHGGNFLVPPVRRAGTVMTIHDLAYRFFPETLDPVTARTLADLPQRARAVDVIITPTLTVADEVAVEMGIPAERIVAIGHGVRPEWFDADPPDAATAARLGLPQEYLLFVGTREPRKNLAGLVAAYRRARAERAQLPPLVIVGARGWGRQPDEQVPGVRALGYLHDVDLRSVVAGARTVFSPSVYEGFGLPVLEALAAGAPVVASDIGAHREIASGSVQLVSWRDGDGWVEALLRAADTDPGIGRQQRREAARAFSWPISAAAHRQVYERVAR